MRIDTVLTDVRVFPLVEVTREQLEELAGARIVKVEPVLGGVTNTIHKVRVESGETYAIKLYAGGKDWFETELTTLTLLHGTLPVPEVVHANDERFVIVYRWIDGITLHDLRSQGKMEAYASLAEPLGRVLAWLAKSDATEPFELTQMLEQCYARLSDGPARMRLGDKLADSMRRLMEAAEPDMAWGNVCLSHGDMGHRNVIVYQLGDRWRINGVIDWETASTGSPLLDVGALFRYSNRYDSQFCEAFEAGYRDGGGVLPANWLATSRLLDATWIVDMLSDEEGPAAVFRDCRRLVAELVQQLS